MTHRLLPLVLLAALAASGTASAQTMVRDTLDIELNVRTHYTSYVDSAGNTVVGCSNVIIGVHPDPLGNGRDGDYRYHSIVNGTIPTNYYYAHDVLDRYGDPGDIPGERISYTAAQNSAATCANSNAIQGLQEFAARLRSYATYSIPEGPLALFEWEQTDGLTVRFDGTASRVVTAQGRRPVSSHSWSYGTPSTTAVTEHTFQQPGDYDVTLTVTDRNGNEDSQTRTVTVTGHQLTVKAVPLEPGRHYALADTFVIETTVTNTGGSSALDVTVPPHTETPYDAPPRPSDSVVLRPLLKRLGTREPEMRAVLGVGESIVTRDSFRVDGYAGYVIRSPRETVHQEIRLWGEMPGRIEASSGTEEPVLIQRPCKGGACETVTVGPPEAAFSAQARVEQTEGTQGETLLFIGTVENTGGVPLRTLSASADFDIEVVFPDSVEGRPQTEPVFRAVPETKAPVTRAEFASGDTVEVRRSYVIEDVATYQDADGETREVEVQIIVTMGEVTAETEDGDPVTPDRSCAVPPSGSQALARRVPPECGRNTADVIPLSSDFVVNSNEDEPDEELGDGTCDTGRRLTVEGQEIRECTLRAALQEALASGGGTQQTIAFDVLGSSPTITLTSPLDVNSSVVIDATTQPSYQTTGDEIGVPVLEVVGSEALLISAADVEIRGLVIQNGIHVTGDRVRIEKTYLGTDRAGFAAAGRADGVFVDGAADTQIEFNLISGNARHGVVVIGEGAFNTTIQKNIIGLNRDANQALGNRRGIYFENAPRASTSIVGQNNISGNREQGIGLNRTDGLSIQRNWIGVTLAGNVVVPNGLDGILVNVSDNTEVTENVIVSSPEAYAISVSQETPDDKSTGTVISNNTLGMDAERAAALGSGRIRVRNAVGTTVDGGNFAGAIEVAASDETRVSGNFIGVRSDGGPLGGTVPDTPFGIEVRRSTDATIANNLVAHRSGSGVRVEESARVEVVQNVAFANGGFGIGASSSSGTRIVGNQVSSNAEQGVLLIRSDSVEVSGNRIGVNGGGDRAIPNGLEGVLVNVSSFVVIRENLIASGPEACAVSVSQESAEDRSTGAVVINNSLGTDEQRTTALGFGCIQVRNAIGTNVEANFAGAITVDASAMTSVVDNFVGTGLDGESPLAGEVPGVLYGVRVLESDDTVVTGNVIAHRSGSGIEVETSSRVGLLENRVVDNGSAGVIIRSGTGNVISRNVIARNALLGIDLGGDGVTPNDPLDTDDGANGLLNTPYLALAVVEGADAGGGVTLLGRVGHPDDEGSYSVEVFSNAACHASSFGQGELFVTGFGVSPASEAFFRQSLSAPPDHRFISATASDTAGNTSEFSRCLPLVPRDQVTEADIQDEQTGLLLEGQGISVSTSGGSGRRNTQSSSSRRMVGAGTLFATRYEGIPVGTAFADATSTAPDGSAVRPEALARRSWYLADIGLTEAGGAQGDVLTAEVCVDASGLVPAASADRVVIVRRTDATGGAWTPLDTYRGDSGALCTTGVTTLGEFAIGGSQATFPVASEGDSQDDSQALPTQLALEAPFPNPSSSRATVRLALPEAGHVRLSVLDALGREVAVLEDGVRSAGDLEVALDTVRLTPGVYVVVLEAGGAVTTRTLTVVR